ncbi:Major Facilitator Superfamily protein [compost metagenome]
MHNLSNPLLFLGTLLTAGGYGATFLISHWFHLNGGTDTDAGLTLSMGLIGTFIGVPLVGWWSGKVGAVKLAALGAAGLACGYALLSKLTGANPVALPHLATFMIGLGWGMFYLGAPLALSERVTDRERTSNFTRFSAFQMTGICSSPILLKLFVDQGDRPLEAAFAGVAILAMVASGFLLLSGISVPPTRHNTRFQPWVTKLSVLVGGSAIRPIVMVGLGGAVFSGMMAFQGSLTEGTRSSPSVFFGVHAATAVAARLLLARRLSTWHRNPLMAVLLALLIAGLLCLLGMPLHPAFHIASALLTGAGYGLLYPVIQAWAVNSSKPEDRHAALTWFVISYFVGIFGFPAVGGWLLVASGKTLFIATLIALAALELATAFIGAQPRGNNRTQ